MSGRILLTAVATLLLATTAVMGVRAALRAARQPGPAQAASPAAKASPRPDPDSPAPSITSQPPPIAGALHISGNPAALPGLLLISDRGNSRVLEVDPRGNIVWQFPPPGYRGVMPFDESDDAFYSPDRRYISTNEEFEHTVQVIDRSTERVVWTYGTPFQPGATPNHLNGPDDAYLLPDGRMMTADIKNCRIVVVSPNRRLFQLGHTGACWHDPAHGYFASPNGDAPSPDYRYVVITEITGSWVDVFTFPGYRYLYSFHSPAAYPSDAIMQRDGTFILTDYSAAGAVYRVDRYGHVLWAYHRNLDHPSIAIGLPNGFVCISDDYGDRVLIVDPRDNRIQWQYGVKNVPGRSAGHLYIPDGLDFLSLTPPAAAQSPSPR